jgi:CBS domain-containing protein
MAVLQSPNKQGAVADLMTKKVVTCSPDARLSEAVGKMW